MTDKQCEKLPKVTDSTPRAVRDTWVSEVVKGEVSENGLNITDNGRGASRTFGGEQPCKINSTSAALLVEHVMLRLPR